LIKGILKNIIYLAYLAIITLFITEALIRLWGYSERYLYDPIYMPFAGTSEIPFILKPNLVDARAHGNIKINTDELGLRAQTSGKKYGEKGTNEYRIAVFGDSNTFGVGVPFEDTFPQKVENLLNTLQHRYKVQVFNFGISSYSVKEMVANLKYRALQISPDLAIMAIVYDDFNLSRTPGVDKWGYNTHYGTGLFVSGDSFLKHFLRNLHMSYIVRDFILQLKEYRSYKTSSEDKEIKYNSYHYVKDFETLARANDINSLILTLPEVNQNGSQYYNIINKFNNDGVRYYDISNISTCYTAEAFKASKYDFHPSAVVNRNISELLADYILKNYLNKKGLVSNDQSN
jgi:hypothetical protein